MSERIKLSISVFSGDNEYLREDSDWPPDDPQGFLAWFAAKVALIPPEYAESASITLSGSGGGDYDDRHAIIHIDYERVETPEECAQRDARDEAYRKQREAEEFASYQRLKAKFGAAN